MKNDYDFRLKKEVIDVFFVNDIFCMDLEKPINRNWEKTSS